MEESSLVIEKGGHTLKIAVNARQLRDLTANAGSKVLTLLLSLGFPLGTEYSCDIVLIPGSGYQNSSTDRWILLLTSLDENTEAEIFRYFLEWFLDDFSPADPASFVPYVFAGIPVYFSFREYPDYYTVGWEREFIHLRSLELFPAGAFLCGILFNNRSDLFPVLFNAASPDEYREADSLLFTLVNIEADHYSDILERYISHILVDFKGMEAGVYYFRDVMGRPGFLHAALIHALSGAGGFARVLMDKPRYSLSAMDTLDNYLESWNVPERYFHDVAHYIAESCGHDESKITTWEMLKNKR
ncbi:MAG: hypothetical protein ACRCUT_13375, partial [Spirochaetota bacterium]